MKYLLLTLVYYTPAFAGSYKYCYPSEDLKVIVEAESETEAFKKAAKWCFKALTKGKYPGENEGMRIIDVCSNPRPCK